MGSGFSDGCHLPPRLLAPSSSCGNDDDRVRIWLSLKSLMDRSCGFSKTCGCVWRKIQYARLSCPRFQRSLRQVRIRLCSLYRSILLRRPTSEILEGLSPNCNLEVSQVGFSRSNEIRDQKTKTSARSVLVFIYSLLYPRLFHGKNLILRNSEGSRVSSIVWSR